MSYEIEHKKAAFRVHVGSDKRFPTYMGPHVLLFAIQSCSNNVFPRTPRWNAVATDIVHDWDGRPMLPEVIWSLARDADGGSIKPDGRNSSGTAYIKQWQDTVRNSHELKNDGSCALNKVSIWERDGEGSLTLEAIAGLPADSTHWHKYEHLRADLHAAFHALFDDPQRRFSGFNHKNWTRYISPESPDFLDALCLYWSRASLPFICNLCE